MSEPWPTKREIKHKSNPRLKKDHQDAIEAAVARFHEKRFIWKREICDLIGASDYYCKEPGKGRLNWDFIKQGILEELNGPRPSANGDAEGLEEYLRDSVSLLPMTTHLFEDIQETGGNLSKVDPDRRHLWLPLKCGHGADGWISSREPAFALAVSEHFNHSTDWQGKRARKLSFDIAGAYDSKALDRDDARQMLEDILRAPKPRTLEDLTGPL